MIKRIPDVFKTPAAMFHDPEAQSKLQQLIETILTQRRSSIKSKVCSASGTCCSRFLIDMAYRLQKPWAPWYLFTN